MKIKVLEKQTKKIRDAFYFDGKNEKELLEFLGDGWHLDANYGDTLIFDKPQKTMIDKGEHVVKYSNDVINTFDMDLFFYSFIAIDFGRGFDFGEALLLLKQGYKLERKGWNEKGMFVYLVPETAIYNAYFVIKNVNEIVYTWVPSVNDCLAEDWFLVK